MGVRGKVSPLLWSSLGSILPQGSDAGAEAVSLQIASLVSAQVLAILASDGKASALQELKDEVLRSLAI